MRLIREWWIYFRTLVITLKDPERMSLAERNKTIKLITRLGKIEGFPMRFSLKLPFTLENIRQIPRSTRGVYRFIHNERIIYIGASCTSIRKRLKLRYGKIQDLERADSIKLAEIYKTGDLQFAWKATPFPGWIEQLLLAEYKEKNGSLPECNSQGRSNILIKCLY